MIINSKFTPLGDKSCMKVGPAPALFIYANFLLALTFFAFGFVSIISNKFLPGFIAIAISFLTYFNALCMSVKRVYATTNLAQVLANQGYLSHEEADRLAVVRSSYLVNVFAKAQMVLQYELQAGDSTLCVGVILSSFKPLKEGRLVLLQ